MFEITETKTFDIGMHVANFLEAVRGIVEDSYTVQNWDPLRHNIYEGKTPSGMVDEYVNSGADESRLNQLVEGLSNSYPEEKNRPEYVKEVLKSIESKLSPED